MDFFKKKAPRVRSIDDLILMRDFVNAEEKIRNQLREQNDPKLRMKLGNVLRELGRGEEAIVEYLEASDQFLAKGFTDRAHASATRARKISPQMPEIDARFLRIDRRKRIDMIRPRAVEALKQQTKEGQRIPSGLEIDQAWELLAKCEWMHQVPDAQLVPILRQAELVKFTSGKRVAAEGALDGFLLLIFKGEVEARRIGPKGMVTLRTFGAGDLLGEKVLLDRAPWPVSLISLVETEVLRLDRAGFEAALVGNSDPRGLIDALRTQRNDDELDRLIRKL